jgi:hypothetical protein
MLVDETVGQEILLGTEGNIAPCRWVKPGRVHPIFLGGVL